MPAVIKFFVRLFFTVGLLSPGFATAAFPAVLTPIINEAMISNRTVYPDETGGFYDWIELFNPGEAGVNLAGYGLSDDETLPFKWKFPDTVIPAGGYLVVFASDRDTTASGSFPSRPNHQCLSRCFNAALWSIEARPRRPAAARPRPGRRVRNRSGR